MTSKSLESQVVITFALFLLIAIISVSFVWVTLLHRQMVSALAENLNNRYVSVEQIVKLLEDVPGEKLSESLLGLYSNDSNESCYQVRFRGKIISNEFRKDCSNDRLEGSTSSFRSKLEHKGQVTFSGSAWAVFTFSHKYIHLERVITDHSGVELGTVAFSASLEPLYSELRHKSKMAIVYGFATILILTSIIYIRIRSLIFAPVKNIIAKTNGYTLESELFLSPHSANNEFGQLSMSIKQMIRKIESDRAKLKRLVGELQESNRQLIENKKEMVKAEKLASVGQLAAGLAHEIGNPLGIVQGYVDMLGTGQLEESERRQFAIRADGELRRISGLLRQLLDFSRSSDSVKTSRVDLVYVLSRIVEMVKSQKDFSSILLTHNLGKCHHEVVVDEDQLQQVLINCLLNALEAVQRNIQKEKKIHIQCDSIFHDRFGQCASITISDNGPGLGSEELHRAFDPFFTTRAPGKGTGLGLYVSFAIIESFGGSITLVNNESGGATVEILLPVAGS